MRIIAKILYWLAVLLISLALLVALVLFFESRDDSNLGTPQEREVGAFGWQPPPAAGAYAGSTLLSLANTMIRSAAL